jgi:hypothetical protein
MNVARLPEALGLGLLAGLALALTDCGRFGFEEARFDASVGCGVNPANDPTCPGICAETCRAADDDCDGVTDADAALTECVASDCDFGFADCNGDDPNGCEVDLTDPNHCSCSNACTSGPHVQSGVCTRSGCSYSCEPNYEDCTASVGCETDLLETSSCGDCNNNCNALPAVALATCTLDGDGPVCGISSCTGGHGNCNGDASDGCEEPTSTSALNCGACSGQPGHQPCTNLPNVDTSTCSGGSCGIIACAGNYEDCDGDPQNGCERNPAVDPPCCDVNADVDGDGSNDCVDLCRTDPGKTTPGVCGCFIVEGSTDSDGDGAVDCTDACVENPNVQGDCQRKRKRLTVQGSEVPSAQAGFPVLVRIASDASLALYADPTGLDISFQDAAGTPLPFERESYTSSTGALVAWVKMDLTGANQDFYVYYGAGDLSEKSTAGAVWDSEYEAVYHLQDLTDSTSHGRDCSDRGTTSHASGQIGVGRDFNGNAELIGPRGVLPTGDSFWTVSYWGLAQPSNASGDDEQWAVSTQDFAQDGMSIGIETPPAISNNGNMLTYVSGWQAYGGTVMPDAVWARVDARVYMSSNGYVEYSLDGGAWERKNLDTNPLRHTNGSYISIGGEEANTDENWLGQLDEVRISSTLRSNDWLQAEYNNQRAGSTFVSVGVEESL